MGDGQSQGADKENVLRRSLVVLLLLAIPVVLYAREYNVVAFKTETAGTVEFRHDVHLRKLGRNCTKCHNAIFKIAKKNPSYTMADMEKGKSCGTCHDGRTAFKVTECVRCHKVGVVAIEIPDFGAATFSHPFHLSMYSCTDCHNSLFKPSRTKNPHVTMAQMEKGAACGACHDGSTAFSVKGDCTKCHKVKDIHFGAQATFSHTFHLGMFSCRECHTKIFIAGKNSKRYTMAQMQQGKSCGACHDGSTAFSVKGDCDKCHTTVKDVVFKADDARFSHGIHTAMFKCGDCHSSIFIGGVNSKRYSMAQMEQGKSCGACHDGSTAFSVTGSCDKCHHSTKPITFTIKDAGTVTFSHEIHTGMFKCDDCHNKVFTTGSRAQRFTMSQMEKGKGCGACHDGKTAFTVAGNCSKCHPVKDVVFPLDARFSHDKHLEMFSCYECHAKRFIAGPGNKHRTMADMEKGKSCGGCHDGSTAFSVKGDCGKCHTSTVNVEFRNPATGVTVFSHKVHTAMFKCDECHNGIFTAGKEAVRHTMADMAKGKSCGACHDGSTAFSVKDSCAKCHPVKEIQFKDSGARFSHTFHLQAYSCSDCHDTIFIPGPGNRHTTMAEMEKGQSCGACHDGSTAFSVTNSCEKCHIVTKAIKYEFADKTTGSVLFSHKVHVSRGYNCIDCHNKNIITAVGIRTYTMKDMESGKYCGACHGMAMAFSVKDSKKCGRCHASSANDLFHWTPPE